MKKYVIAFAVAFIVLVYCSSVSTANEDNQNILRSKVISDLQDAADETGAVKTIGRPITIKASEKLFLTYDEGVEVKRAYMYTEELCNLPPELIENVSEIYITNRNLNDVLRNVDFSAYGSEDKSFFITGYAEGHSVCVNAERDDGNTLIHEIMHIYDKWNGKLSSDAAFIDIYNKERSNLSSESYRAVSPAEYMAIGAELYYYNNEYLKAEMPETYRYFNQLFTNMNFNIPVIHPRTMQKEHLKGS